MPDVFISYARSDRKRVAVIAEALEGEGYSLWWEGLARPGKAEQEMLRQQLLTAHCVIVCWSRNSATSDSVLTEANQGYNQQKLVPVTLQACDPPMPFNMVASADLTEWDGEANDEYWVDTIAEVRRLVEKGRKLVSAPAPQAPVVEAPKAAIAKEAPRKTAPAPSRPETGARAPRYQASRPRRKSSGVGKLFGWALVAAAVLGAIVWAGPKAFRYIENKMANPQQAAALDPALTAPLAAEPLVTEPPPMPISVIPIGDEPKLVSAAPSPVVAVKPRVQLKPVAAPSAAPTPPPSIVAPPPLPPLPPKAMAAMEDVEKCMQQVARGCDVSTADFRTDGQFSAGERRLMSTALFPDGAQPTQDNLAACKAGTTRRARNSDEGKAVCAALR